MAAGRKPFTPTPEMRLKVGIQAACGLPQPMIAEGIVNPTTGRPIDLKTLRRAFRTELDDGAARANALVAQSLFKKATGTGQGAVTAAIFWLKTKGGWKETVRVENTGKDGAPIQHEHRHSATDAELEAIATGSGR